MDPDSPGPPRTPTLLGLLLSLPLDVELLLVASELRGAFPFKLVPVDCELVLDVNLVIHELPHGGERSSAVLQFQVLELLRLLVRPAHGPGELFAVLLERQGGHPLLAADLVLAFPGPDRVRLVALRARKTAESEYQRCRKDRLHDRLQEMTGGKPSNADRPPAAHGDSRDAAITGQESVDAAE